MLAPHAHVITRRGIQGSVLRTVTADPPYLYLVASLDGQSLIVTESDLRPYIEVAAGISLTAPWNGVERRNGERRRVQNDPPPHERRGAERRWLQLSVATPPH